MADHEKENSASGEPLPAAISAISAEDRADLVNALKDKLQNLAGKHYDSFFIDSLSPKVKNRVEVLREIQSQYDELEKRFLEEKAALEARYQKLYDPLYTKRYEVVNGVVEAEAETTEVVTGQENKVAEEKGVPDFWLRAMKNNDILADEITERDEGALKYLKDIKWFKLDNPMGFKLEFLFDLNPYFKNSILTKAYYMVDDDFDHPILEKAIGTEIEWNPGKCLTKKVLKKKLKKGSKNAKPITKTENCESFFNFFKPPQVPEDDDDDDIDGDLIDVIEDQMEQDFNIGTIIAEKLIPRAVSWYTGEAVQDDEFDDLEDDDDEDDDEDGDDEDADK